MLLKPLFHAQDQSKELIFMPYIKFLLLISFSFNCFAIRDYSKDKKYMLETTIVFNNGKKINSKLPISYPTYEELWCDEETIFFTFNIIENEVKIITDSELNSGPDSYFDLVENGLNSNIDFKQNNGTGGAIKIHFKIFDNDENSKIFAKARSLFESEKFEESLTKIETISDAVENYICVLNLKGSVLSELKKFEQAIPYYSLAISISPNNDRLYYSRSWRYNKLSKHAEALKDLNTSIGINDSYWEPYFLFNEIYSSKKDYLKAIHYSTLGFKHRKGYYFHKKRAWNYYYNENYKLALIDFEKVIELDKDSYDGYTGKAEVLKSMGKIELALDTIATAIKVHGKDIYLFNELGIYLDDLERYQEAITAYEINIMKFGGNGHTYNNLGFTYIKLGDFQKAISIYQSALEKELESDSLLNNLASAYYFNKDYDNAIKYFQQSIDKSSFHSAFENAGIARSYIQKGDLEQAVFYLNKVIGEDPNYYDALYEHQISDGNFLNTIIEEFITLARFNNNLKMLNEIEVLKDKLNEN
jgi:tetratricopeptide (TPR) repeat protein